jgi:hypothetical protein
MGIAMIYGSTLKTIKILSTQMMVGLIFLLTAVKVGAHNKINQLHNSTE